MSRLVEFLLNRTDAEYRKVRDPRPGEEVCPVCKGALLTTHKHGVWIHPRPDGEPAIQVMPSVGGKSDE